MAGHCLIGVELKHITLLKEFLSNNNIDEMKDFQTTGKKLPHWIKLSKEYSMFEFDNLEEEEAYIIGYQMKEATYEYHLNKDKNIIALYLVM